MEGAEPLRRKAQVALHGADRALHCARRSFPA